MTNSSAKRRGFTLVEILIVVIILGILAAIVIPQFTDATSSSRTTSIMSTLHTLRGQTEVYKLQHSDSPPPLSSFWAVMTTWTDTTGDTTAAADTINYPNGPYVLAPPVNPLNGNTSMSSTAASSADGWYYSVSGTAYTIYARDTSGNSMTSY